MVKNKNFDDIELNLVLDKIRALSLFAESSEYINYSAFTCDEALLDKRYIKIDDIMHKMDGEYSLESFPSISHIFAFAKKSHQDIQSKDVYLIGVFLSAYEKMLSFLSREGEIESLFNALKTDILSSLDFEGNVVENHPRLLPLKRELERSKSRRSSYAESFMRENKSIMMGDNPLYRDQRIVLPVKAFEKGKVSGYLQGESQSGQTLYMESLDLINYNNDVVLAEERIKEEERAIKHELSLRVRDNLDAIRMMREDAIDFDFHYSFASCARKNGWKHIRKGNFVKLVDASHPLLKKAVPVSITIDESIKSVVFSGANAGGKTVTMKTIALLSALNQIGTFIPAKEESVLPYFDKILTDIGDGQSILDDESTFSSHLANISYITKNTTKESLILLDELGSGTDPDEGSALALSILDYLMMRSKLTLSSSHYSKVKNHAYVKEGMMNASMAFSTISGLPLYRVVENIPGDSHALDAAKRARLPKEIVDNAFTLLSDKSESAASLISSLISKSRTLDRKISEAEGERRKALSENERLKERLKEEDEKIRELEKEGLKDISDFLSKARRKLENLISDITTGKLDKSKIKSAKAFMDDIKKEEEKIKKRVDERESEDQGPSFVLGDAVLCGKSRISGKIIEKNKNSYLVLLDTGLKLNLKASDIEKATERKKTILPTVAKSTKKAQYEMDIRGERAEEAIKSLDDQMEAAIISNLKSFSVIHGLGDGKLMQVVRNYLKRRGEVESYYFARPEDGGMGKTYVELK